MKNVISIFLLFPLLLSCLSGGKNSSNESKMPVLKGGTYTWNVCGPYQENDKIVGICDFVYYQESGDFTCSIKTTKSYTIKAYDTSHLIEVIKEVEIPVFEGTFSGTLFKKRSLTYYFTSKVNEDGLVLSLMVDIVKPENKNKYVIEFLVDIRSLDKYEEARELAPGPSAADFIFSLMVFGEFARLRGSGVFEF